RKPCPLPETRDEAPTYLRALAFAGRLPSSALFLLNAELAHQPLVTPEKSAPDPTFSTASNGFGPLREEPLSRPRPTSIHRARKLERDTHFECENGGNHMPHITKRTFGPLVFASVMICFGCIAVQQYSCQVS